MHYSIEQSRDCLQITDRAGRVVESYDHNEWSEATQRIEELNSREPMSVAFLVAAGKWTTRQKKKLFVPKEEFRREFTTVQAASIEDAERILRAKFPGAIIRDVKVS